MSRTYRKQKEPFSSYYRYAINSDRYDEEYLKTEKWRYTADRGVKYYSYGLPKFFRNMVNRKRRARDRQELYKAVKHFEYEEQCSKWNCKDADHWGYW